MNERANLLHNMCANARSRATVTPRRIEPPVERTNVKGAKTRSKVGVIISLLQLKKSERHASELFNYDGLDFLRKVFELLYKDINKSDKDKDFYEDALVKMINFAIEKYSFVGCFIMEPIEDDKDKVLLPDIELTFAILAKSTGKLFIPSKTPNFACHLFKREYVCYDPRLVSLVEKRK